MAEVRAPRCSETIDLEECLAAKAGARDHGTLGVALAYAERGWAVFPCQGKHPLTKHGCKDATTDAAALRQLWQRFPPPNIGLATGKASGIWVLDVDGPAGEATLAELEARHGPLPRTVVARTGGGGRHLLFRYNGESIKNRAKDIGDGLDVRATGGYIIAPPSVHPETKALYQWDAERHPESTPIADAPAWLTELACGKNRRQREQLQDQDRQQNQRTTTDNGSLSGGSVDAWAAKTLKNEIQAVAQASKGRRNNQLNRSAFSLGQMVGGKYLSHAPVREALVGAATDNGLVADEGKDRVMATINSGLNAGIALPRKKPEPEPRQTEQKRQDAGSNPNGADGSAGKAGDGAEDDAAKETKSDSVGRLKLVLFDEITPRLTSNYIVKGVLGDGEMGVVYGESGGGKTFFALDLALHIAADKQWRSRRVRQGGVVYVAAEGGHGINNRVVAFKRQHDIEGRIPFAAVPCAVDLLNPDADTGSLIDLIKVATERFGMPVKLVVIDTLSRAMAGGNENAPDDMGAYVRNVDRIREVTKAHVMSIHHSGKDAAKGARGHSLLRAATDAEIEVSRDSVTKVVTARVMKQKELPTEGEFAFNLESVELGQDEDGDPVTSCVVTECDAEPAPVGPKLTGKALVGLRKLADCIIDQGVTLPPSRHVPSHVTGVTLDQWRDYLQQAGIINRDGNPRQQFGRIRDKLVETGRIAIWGNLVWLVRKVSHSTDARRAPIFHNTDSASQVQNKPCDGVTPCKEEVFSENVTSVTSCHNGHSDASRHVTSPYKGCDGVTRDMTADVTAGNANGQRAVEEVEQHSNGPPAGSPEPAPSVPPDIEVVFKDVEP